MAKKAKWSGYLRPQGAQRAYCCGLVSASPLYNKKLKNLNRKTLAIETELGGLFFVAQEHNVDALSIRGISDYEEYKNRFESETKNNGRKNRGLQRGFIPSYPTI